MNTPRSPRLLSIIAHARSGALDHAWRLFREGGLEGVANDASVLSLKGRLLKDRALEAAGDERRRFYLEAAEAYAQAGAINGETYPLINAATLALLAGRPEQARQGARRVLDRIAHGDDEGETPYWHAATRSEALLLLGQVGDARAALGEAIERAPQAWEDHASTLRQFGLLLAELGEDARWLDAFRPPRTLHFAGHMAVAADPGDLRARVDAFLDSERIGFGWGALAAGADIVIAEALLAHGAELNLVLPAGREVFRETSAAAWGEDWAERFDAVLAQADTARAIGPATDPLQTLGIRLGAEAAMGGAVMQARTLTTEAVQLLILDGAEPVGDDGGASAFIRAAWADSGRRQEILIAPRNRATPIGGPAQDQPDTLLAALLAVEVSTPAGAGAAYIERLAADILPRIAAAVAAAPAPMFAPRWAGKVLTLAYATPGQAATAALAVASALKGVASSRIGGHYGVIRKVDDPFGGGPLLLGEAANIPALTLVSAPPGAIHVTEDFAAALHAGRAMDRPRTEYVGDLPSDDPEDEIRLFCLKA